jgi:hypothetical protein
MKFNVKGYGMINYISQKDNIIPLTINEFNELKNESLPNTHKNIKYYRNLIFRLIKTIEISV